MGCYPRSVSRYPFQPPEQEIRSHPLEFADRQAERRLRATGPLLRWETWLLAVFSFAALGAVAWLNLT